MHLALKSSPRVFGMVLAPQSLSGLTFTHLGVKDRLWQVNWLADILASATAQLKVDRDMKRLTMVAGASQSRQAGGNTASTPASEME